MLKVTDDETTPMDWSPQIGKIKFLKAGGFIQTGVIMMDPRDGRRALVDHARVKWLTKDEADVILGHKEQPTVETTP